jgi:predicted ATPase
MLTYIKINGFKSFHNFEMEFTPFTVIAGANASGKSNLFDALKLLGRLAESDNLKKAFKEQRGEFIELFTLFGENSYSTEMEFVVEMLVNNSVKDAWGEESVIKYKRLRYELNIKRFTNASGIEDLAVTYESLEAIKQEDDKWVNNILKNNQDYWQPSIIKNKKIYIKTKEEDGKLKINLSWDGANGKRASKIFNLHNAVRTVLSSIDTIDFPHVLAAKEEMRSWKFLEFNPEDLRQPTSKNNGEDVLSQSGKNLAAVLYRIKQENSYNLKEISRKLQTFLPNFIEVDVVDDNENKQYLIKLKDKDKKEYSSRVLSEGTLRILALCILEYDDKHTGLLCFEEPENGIHPFKIKAMAELLKGLSTNFSDVQMPLHQVIVNTHSPVLVSVIFKWQHDNNVSIWYAEMRNRVTDIQNKRMTLSITSILPVIKEDGRQLLLNFTDQERKMTLTNVKNYLETASNQS